MRFVCLGGLLGYATFGMAAEFADPTRPLNLSAPVADSAVIPTDSATGLQAILLSRTRHAAIIDGKTVELGQWYGTARLIEIHVNHVVLVNAHGRQVLKLFPDIKITHKPNEVAPHGGQNRSSVERKENK